MRINVVIDDALVAEAMRTDRPLAPAYGLC